MGQIVIYGGRAGDGNAPKSSAFGGEGAVLGVFKGDGFGSCDVKFFYDRAIEVGRGFAGRNIFDATQVIETTNQAQSCEVPFDVGMIGIRSEADPQSSLPGLLQVLSDAGENGLFCQQLLIDVLQFALECLAIGGRTKRCPLVEMEPDPSDGLVGELAGERFPRPLMNDLTGINQSGFGVED